MALVKNKKHFYFFILTVEPLLALISYIVFLFQKKPFASVFYADINPILGFAAGCGIGILVSVPCVLFVYKNKIFADVLEMFDELLDIFGLKMMDFIIVSLLAGICEEILFRATFQPMLGVWLTSFIFILLHGYFNPKNWKIFLFGVIMFAISVLIGFVYKWLGLFAAIGLHSSYDFLVLFLLSIKKNKNRSPKACGYLKSTINTLQSKITLSAWV